MVIQRRAKHECRLEQRALIIIAAAISGGVGWAMTAMAIQGSILKDFRELDAMSPTAESTFHNIFLQVLVSGLSMFAISFLACIAVFWDNKYMLMFYTIFGLGMGTILTMSAVSSTMLLNASVPPIIITTNRICRNFEEASEYFGCPYMTYRRLQEEVELPQRTLAETLRMASVSLAWAEEPRTNATRRLQQVKEFGSTEAQLIERIGASEDEDVCNVLKDLCKLPEGRKSMDFACTCNGQPVADLVGFDRKSMDWVCPQPVYLEHAPDECGSFCADWGGEDNLQHAWCFVNKGSACKERNIVLFGSVSPSMEACRVETLLENPWSGLVGRGIAIAKTGMIVTSVLAFLMFASAAASWCLVRDWCYPGRFSEQVDKLNCDKQERLDDGASAPDLERMSSTSLQESPFVPGRNLE